MFTKDGGGLDYQRCGFSSKIYILYVVFKLQKNGYIHQKCEVTKD